MQQMTIGQRIASRRKLLNFSQEALAERLEVSRQAVSRWESDSAIPEIDKLIGLSRIFGVSVGWLLGTEKDPNFDPSTGLSEAQLKMVEQLLEKQHRSSKRIWLLVGALAICMCAVFSLFGMRYHQRLVSLTQNNEKLQSQIGTMNDLLLSQAEAEKLLNDVKILPYLSDDRENIAIEFYCTPKMMPENTSAYVSVVNPTTNINKLLKCAQSGDMYWVQTKLPPADGYRYSFLMVTEDGFREQILSKEGLEEQVLTNLYSAMRFVPALEDGQRSDWDKDNLDYTYSMQLYLPQLMVAKNTYIRYEDVRAVLRLNGDVIWEQSYMDAIVAHAGFQMRSTEPWNPELSVTLPQLAAGDILQLEMVVDHNDGRQVVSILETLNVQ